LQYGHCLKLPLTQGMTNEEKSLRTL
jgi:hypothetical protein